MDFWKSVDALYNFFKTPYTHKAWYFCSMRLYIKNMVCNRCVMTVEQLLNKIGLPYSAIGLGEVHLVRAPSATELTALKEGLQQVGFELLDDSRKQLIEKIKTLVIRYIHQGVDADRQYNFSHILSSELHKDYSYLSHLFSEVEGLTIEKYIINQKIEKAKELLAYDQMSLGEIAFELGYSSVAHLSAQFKKVTGLTPSYFKKIGALHRKSLDQV